MNTKKIKKFRTKEGRAYNSNDMARRKKRILVKKQQRIREFSKKFGRKPSTRRQETAKDSTVVVDDRKKRGKKRKGDHWLKETMESTHEKIAQAKAEKRAKIEAEIAEKKKWRKKQDNRRRRTHTKLEKRTTKGQPVMRNQIEHLLRKIQKTRREEVVAKTEVDDAENDESSI
eukprot:g607.t1